MLLGSLTNGLAGICLTILRTKLMTPSFIDTILNDIPNIKEIKPLAKGGQKEVYTCQHGKYGKVILKIIHNPDERATREIQVAQDYCFENVPHIFDWAKIAYPTNNVIYILEQYIDGQTLRTYLNTHQIMPLPLLLQLLRTLLIGAESFEKRRIVHRDIKPENIMLSVSNDFWILDFGIARHLDKCSLTRDISYFGPHTPGYAAIEQFRNFKKEIDIRTDLFSIGVVCYEALTGINPFIKNAQDFLDILHKTETYEPSLLLIKGDVQKQLAGFINILMSKYPSRRPKSAQEALLWFDALLPTVQP